MDPVIAGRLGREHPLARYLDDFLADLANAGASRHTLRAYRGDLLQFAAHHDGEIAELTVVPVRAYLAGIAELTAASRKRKRAAVASFCHWAVRHDLLAANPMDKIDTVKVPRALPRPAAAADVAKVLAAICSRRPRQDIRCTGCATGCCSRPRTPAARGPPRPAGCTSRTSTCGRTTSTCGSTAKAAPSGQSCWTTAATSRCSGCTWPAPDTPPGRCSAPASTAAAAGRCPTTPRTTDGRATARPPGWFSTSTSFATPTLSVPERHEGRPNSRSARSYLTSIRYSVRHVQQDQDQASLLRCHLLSLTCLTSLTSRNRPSPGTLRNPVQITTATELINSGVSIEAVRRRLGHASSETTQLYALLEDKVADAEIRAARRRRDRAAR